MRRLFFYDFEQVFQYLSLCCDPDGEASVVPPVRPPLGMVIRQFLSSASVEPHVVNHSMVFNILSYQKREKLEINLISMLHEHLDTWP